MNSQNTHPRTAARTVAILGLFLIALAALPDRSTAQSSERATSTRIEGWTDPGATPLTVKDGRLELSLEQAITLALRRELSLVVERHRYSQSIFGVEQSRSLYDINLQGQFSFQTDVRPTSSILEAADTLESDTTFGQVNLTRTVPTGGQAQINFRNIKSESTNVRQQPNPAFSIDVDFTFSQPLLRNFGRLVTERNILVAKNNAAISRESFRTQVETIVQLVSDGYWNLVEQLEQLKVAEESLQLAEDLHRMNGIQVEVGTLAPLEMVQSEAGVAARREDIIRLRALVGDAADTLRQLVDLDRGELWEVEISPLTSPEVEHRPVDLEAAVDQALRLRPEVLTQKLQVDTLEIDSKVARNQLKPRVDVQGTYALNAIDGEFSAVDFATGEVIEIIASNDYFDAFDQISGRDFDGFTIGVNVVYPLENRNAKAGSAIADLQLDEGEAQLRNLELQVLVDVRSAARALEAAAQRIETAKLASELQRRNLEAARKRYENGLWTSFQVLQIQEDLSEARRAEVSAVINYRRAETAFHRAIGALLEKHDIELVDESP